MFHIGQLSLADLQGSLGITIILGIHLFAFHETFEVVPDYMHLVEGTPEGAGGRQVVHIPQPENVFVLLVL